MVQHGYARGCALHGPQGRSTGRCLQTQHERPMVSGEIGKREPHPPQQRQAPLTPTLPTEPHSYSSFPGPRERASPACNISSSPAASYSSVVYL